MYQYPIQFKAESQSPAGLQQTWSFQSYGHQAPCAIPAEFKGPGGGFSPEDLFVQALTNCLIATFKVYAENSKLSFESLHVHSTLIVDQNENKKVCMKSCHLKVLLTQPSHPQKAELLIKKAFESGFILNSVKTELSYELKIKTES